MKSPGAARGCQPKLNTDHTCNPRRPRRSRGLLLYSEISETIKGIIAQVAPGRSFLYRPFTRYAAATPGPPVSRFHSSKWYAGGGPLLHTQADHEGGVVSSVAAAAAAVRKRLQRMKSHGVYNYMGGGFHLSETAPESAQRRRTAMMKGTVYPATIQAAAAPGSLTRISTTARSTAQQRQPVPGPSCSDTGSPGGGV